MTVNLEPLLGSRTRASVLYHLMERGEGYARGIAAATGCALDTVQKQLRRLQTGGIVKSRPLGRTLVYEFDPEYPLASELQALLRKASRVGGAPPCTPGPSAGKPTPERYIVREIDRGHVDYA